jgi:NTP pyrophosphatase (non-canonical NTP hydrolase)
MDLNTYTALARETAVYPMTHEQEYLALGFVNEACEFYTAFLDWIDCCVAIPATNSPDVLVHERIEHAHAIDELGDLCWYFAMYCYATDRLTGTYFDGSAIAVSDKYLINRIGEFSGAVKKQLRDGVSDRTSGKIEAMLFYFAAHITWFAGELETTVEDVLLGNLKKLNSRKERNMLHGSGDNR